MGVDFSGVVAEVGDEVTKFAVGDAVFGGRSGAFAEYLLVPEDGAITAIPEGVSFESAAAIGVAALTALQSLRNEGGLVAGEKVLINGASGGVGTFAVQIAKHIGAEVHCVCSTRNVERVLALGADRVFDYKKENYIDSGERYDLIIDNVGNHSILANRSVLADDGRYVIVGAPGGDWLGPLLRPLLAMLIDPFVGQELVMLMAQQSAEDLEALASLAESGQLRATIDRRYGLEEIADAIRYSETGRARGKIIIEVND